jgi:hypothetical protein
MTVMEHSIEEGIVAVPASAVDIELFETLQSVVVRNPSIELMRAGIREGFTWRRYGDESAYAFFDAALKGERELRLGTVETWVFADSDEEITIRGMLTSDEERPTTFKTEADPDPSTSQGHESSQEPTLSAARSWLNLTEEIHRAGGAPGDLLISIDGVQAAQVVAEWEDGSRPRRAGEAITIELERLGKRLTIHARWREPQGINLPTPRPTINVSGRLGPLPTNGIRFAPARIIAVPLVDLRLQQRLHVTRLDTDNR